ncbi:hypothetical protein [Serratia marcescens]|nr:hypothetical protein [Serratia marcescens]
MRRPRNYKMLSEVMADLLLVAGLLLITLGSLAGFVYLLALIAGGTHA